MRNRRFSIRFLYLGNINILWIFSKSFEAINGLADAIQNFSSFCSALNGSVHDVRSRRSFYRTPRRLCVKVVKLNEFYWTLKSSIGVVRNEFYSTELKIVRSRITKLLKFDNKPFFRVYPLFVGLFITRKSVSVPKS